MGSLTVGIIFGIIALSLTLLTGYAVRSTWRRCPSGRSPPSSCFTSACPARGRQRITFWGLLLGMAVTAVVGGLIALPALRLRGLYLALATLAFGVFVSDMIIADIAPHVLPIFHLHYSIFPNGTLQMPALKLGPIDLSSSKTFLTTATCIFILVGIGLIALRRSNYGRRLTAMKDSPAAAATLGQNLIKLKLSVFMISAAIAGSVACSCERIGERERRHVHHLRRLALVMLTVVGGIGNVAGALMGGSWRDGVPGPHLDLHEPEHRRRRRRLLERHGQPLPGGTRPHRCEPGPEPERSRPDIVARYKPLWQAKGVLLLGVMAEVVAYLLVLTKVMGNWWLVLATALIAIALPAVGRLVEPEAFRTRPRPPAREDRRRCRPPAEPLEGVADARP